MGLVWFIGQGLIEKTESLWLANFEMLVEPREETSVVWISTKPEKEDVDEVARFLTSLFSFSLAQSSRTLINFIYCLPFQNSHIEHGSNCEHECHLHKSQNW